MKHGIGFGGTSVRDHGDLRAKLPAGDRDPSQDRCFNVRAPLLAANCNYYATLRGLSGTSGNGRKNTEASL